MAEGERHSAGEGPESLTRTTGDELEDLRVALNDDQMILKAAAMLKVSRIEHHDAATGALRHEEN